jgi:DNA repair photolyase
MSFPILCNDLAEVYEYKAPVPTLRLETLRAAKAAGLHVYVATGIRY